MDAYQSFLVVTSAVDDSEDNEVSRTKRTVKLLSEAPTYIRIKIPTKVGTLTDPLFHPIKVEYVTYSGPFNPQGYFFWLHSLITAEA